MTEVLLGRVVSAHFHLRIYKTTLEEEENGPRDNSIVETIY